jgi:ABC-type phosphate/phosphonate transport system substrate-binding protein
VFHGFEYAWLQPEFPELRPLMIAVNKQHAPRVYLLTHKDSPARTFADLKGKTLAESKRTPEQCRYFLASECRRSGAAGPKEFFGKIVVPPNLETALDELVQRRCDATVTDTAGLEFYKDLKPGAAARLRVAAQSAPLPPLVIAYRTGNVPDATLARVRTGLNAAEKTDKGRAMLRMWKITSFEPVPADFVEVLAQSRKTFPRLEVKK